MSESANIKQAFQAALPIVLGYVAIGIPCGILCASINLKWWMVLIMSLLFYSGAGQFMIPNMFLAGAPIASIIASVSLVNTRQMLYAASFAKRCQDVKKRLSFLFAATMTDESFGVNTTKYEEGEWSIPRATWVNLFSLSSWTLSNVVGVFIGNAINIPLPIASFAMTSIFICLMCTQRMIPENLVAIVCAMAGVFCCKAIGLTGPAILIGAIVGVVCAFAASGIRRKKSDAVQGEVPAESHTQEVAE